MLDLIAACYDLGPLGELQPLTGGEWNQVYSFQDGHRKFILRIAHPNLSLETLNFSHRIMAEVGLPEVYPPLKTFDGETTIRLGGKLSAVFPYVEGVRLDLGSTNSTQAGNLLGSIHRQTALLALEAGPTLENMDWNSNFLWHWDQVQESLKGCAQSFAWTVRDRGIDLAAERHKLQAWVQSQVSSGWTRACMHGDYYPGNLLGHDGEIVAAIDWDEARVEWTFWEVGRAIWECCQTPEGTHLNLARTAAFLEGYRAAVPPEFDLALLGPTMRYTRLVDVLWDLTEATRTNVWSEEQSVYHLSNLLAMEKLSGIEF